MKKILFTLGLLALPSIASADFFGFLDRSATRDTVSIPIKITDSLGSPVVLVSGDSVYITVFSPGGTVVFVDSMAFNDASINSYAWEDFAGRDYVYTERISVLDGASTSVGMFTLYAHTQNLTSAALEDQKSTSFYIGDNLWSSLLANLDATISSRSSHAATAIVSAGAITTSSGAVVTTTTATNVTTVNGLAADVITASSLAASAITELLDSLFNTRVDADTGSGSYYGSLLNDLTAIRDSLQFLVTGGGGSLDSQIVSNIVHRVANGTPKGSGSDSSTLAERDVTVADLLDNVIDSTHFSDSAMVAAAFATSWYNEFATKQELASESADSNWLSLFVDRDGVAGSFGDSAQNWAATSASSLDSQVVSNIMHRVGWGTPKGSGSDSSTLAERDVDIQSISGDTNVDDSLEAGLDGYANAQLTNREHLFTNLDEVLSTRSKIGDTAIGGDERDVAIAAMRDSLQFLITSSGDTGLAADEALDSLKNHDDWVAHQTTVDTLLDSMGFTTDPAIHNLVRNPGFERDSALANTAPDFWAKGIGTHTTDESKTSTVGGRWAFQMNPAVNETSFVYQYVGKLPAGQYWLGGTFANTNQTNLSLLVIDNIIPTTISVHIDSVIADTSAFVEQGKIITLADTGDVFIGLRVNRAGLSSTGNFDNIKLINIGFDTTAYQGSAAGLDSQIVSNIMHRVGWGTPKGSGSDSSTLAERDVQVAGIDNATIDSGNFVDGALRGRHFEDSYWDSLANRSDSGAAGGTGLDSATTSRIIHRIAWGTPQGSGSDSSTQAERDVTGTSDLLSYMDSLIYAGAIWINAAAGNTNTVIGTDGTHKNPVSTFVAARTLADALGTQQYNIIGNGTLTLAATHEEWVFNGVNRGATIALGGQDVDLSVFRGVIVTGAQGGTGEAWFIECELGLMSTVEGHFIECALMDTIGVRNNANIFFDNCHSTAAGLTTPTIDFGVATTNVSLRHYSGGIRLMDASSNDTINVEGTGQIIVSANSANVNLVARGHFTITDSSTGTPNFTVDALFTRAEADLWVWANADTSGSVDTSDVGVWLVNNLQTSVSGTGDVTFIVGATDTSGTDTLVSKIPITMRDLAGNQLGLIQFTNTDGYTTWKGTDGDSVVFLISGTVHNSHIWQGDADTIVVPATLDTFAVGQPTAADSILMGFDVPVSTPSAANTCVITLHLGDIDGITDNEDLFGRKVTFTLPGKHIDTCADPVSIITNVSKDTVSNIGGIVTMQLRYSNCVEDTEYSLTIDHPNFTNKTYSITVPRQATYTLTADDLKEN